MKLAQPALQAGKTLTAALLCVLLAGQLLFAATPAKKPVSDSDERILHALNRFTFGPRPGDIAAIRTLGLKRWFEQQLNPATIDDSALDARLTNFPAMQLPQQTLMQRYPPPQLLRMIDRQGMPLPSDPVERTIYADQLAFYKMAQARKAAKFADATASMKEPDASMKDDMKVDDAKMNAAPADLAPTSDAHVERLYADLDAIKIINLPPNERMARILALSPQELIAFRQSLSRRELARTTQGLTPEQKEILAALPGSTRVVSGELLQSRLLRDIYSDRQLEAVMTDFWLNHFNIYLRKNQNEPYLLPSFERDVIRPNALGKFEALLVATAQSPAMLVYLDNWQSIGPDSQAAARTARARERNPNLKGRPSGLNENYARELMELHTLGVNGGYTQADVTRVAKVFTGWTIQRPFQGAAYQFEPNRHEPGSKQFLGKTIQPSGEEEGLQVLHTLATSPATAKFISTKLAVRFVSDNPPPILVDRMAKSFLASNGDIKTVLRTLFDSPEFWSPTVVRAKVKTPLEFVVSAARATDAQIANTQPLVQSLATLGMPLYGMQTPNGYSWSSDQWVSTGALVTRMNFALVLTGNRLPGVRISLPLDQVSPPERVKRLELTLLGQPVGERTRATVLQQFENTAAQQQAEKDFPIRPGDPDQSATGTMAPQQPTAKGQRRVAFLDAADPSATPVPPTDPQTSMMAGLLIGSPDFQRR